MTRTRAAIAALAVAMIGAVTGYAPPADAATHCSTWVGGCGAVTGSGMG